ncbi:hypothetical protein ACHAW6_003547 [Cyclotella cf. meneghiniana]
MLDQQPMPTQQSYKTISAADNHRYFAKMLSLQVFH